MKPAKTPRANAPNRSAPPANEINALVALFSSGRYADAAEQAKPLTQRLPQHPFGWKVLAAALSRMGRHADALVPMQKTVALSPTDAEAHYNLGTALNALGRHDEAERSFRQATQIAPDYAPAHCSVGNTLQSMGRLQDALASYRRATELAPDYAEAHSNLANALQALGQLDQAEASCRAALRIKPDYPQALCNLGNTLHAMGRLEEAAASYHRALQIEPAYADALSNLGNTLQALGRSEEAVASYRQALSINPALAQAHSNLANTLHSLGRLDEAEACCRNALQFKPDFAEVYSNLGNTLQAQSRLDEAIAAYRRALEIRPDFASAHSNLLFTLNYHPDMSGDDILAAYRAYERQFAQPHYASWRAHGNDRSTQRRLRVGYVSPAFQSHAVRHFLEPLLARHDPAVVEVFAYAELACDDAVTARYQRYVAHWVATRGMSDEALAARIRADAIDILVDVAGHTGGNRLQVFARKPAPVSLHWLDFGYTTGLSAIDYYLSDSTTVPVGSEALFSETPWRLDGPGLVYRPDHGMGEVNTLPALQRGHISFGTLTRAVRINHHTVRVWAQLLHRVPGSQLVVNSGDYRSSSMQQALAQQFAAHGIGPERLQIGHQSPPWDVLRGIDISLDCFPHNSGTTLFESLYLGVPFVTLAGRASVGRMGCAILSGLGHSEWVAHSEGQYVAIAAELAADLPRLHALRAGLRAQMQASALMDEAGFARRIEAAYRQMFERWAQPSSGCSPPTGAAPESLFAHALSAHADGRFDLAEHRYRELLESSPQHADANHNLGALLSQRCQTVAGLPYFKAALEAAPRQEQYWRSYVEALIRADRPLRAYQTMTQGIAHGWRGEAMDHLLERLTGLLPDHGESWRQWGIRLFERGELARAEPVLRHALQLDRLDAQAQHHLAWTLRDQGRCEEALACAQLAVDAAPGWSDAHNTLGGLLLELGRLDQAEQSLRQAIRLLPGHAQAHNNLGNTLSEQRQLAQALDCYRNAVRLDPGYEGAWSNLLFTLNYHPELDAQAIFAGYEEWAARWAGAARAQAATSRCAPSERVGVGRRLRVGYVSPDFCAHSCVHFLEPLLARHDRSQFELFAYAQLRREDEVTQRYRQHVEHWRPTFGLSDEALAAQIAADGIDILLDLAGHTAGNRLGAFACKPAPVSVSWLGFGYTTGLRAIDYYLSDWTTVPPGSEALFSETPWRLDGPGLVYRPAPNMGAVSALPAQRNGHVTFGTLTRAIRINAHTVRVWADILRRVSGSELVVDSPSFRHPWAQDALAREFAARGIARERLRIGCHSPPWDVLRDIDICLDCFPHNSGTTLFESLYLGVPFVTLAGRPSVGRIGSSILQGVGHPEWIAYTESEYVEIAVAMAADLPKLATTRASLRAQMEASPLMDEVGFARRVEAAYRDMFGRWGGT
jgi:predicted O-linked N-acetylglucosamine transferase (SPINDLY family)